MKPAAHVITSAAAGSAAYFCTNSLTVALTCLLSGIFIDLDHLLDFLVFEKNPFNLKAFLSWCYQIKGRKAYLVLHSYELYLLLLITASLFPGAIFTGLLLGVGLHLFLDQVGNKNLHKYFYFLTYRYKVNFQNTVLTTRPVNPC